MRSKLFVALVLLIALSPVGTPCWSLTSPEGDWWINVTKGELGNGHLTISAFAGGTFNVSGTGFFHKKAVNFFSIPQGEHLSVDPRGRYSGTIEIQDDTGAVQGSMEIATGNCTDGFQTLKMAGTLTLGSNDPKTIAISGTRLPSATQVLDGRTIRGVLSGKGVNSRAYDFQVSVDDTLGYPFFILTGTGNVNVSGESKSVKLDGLFLLNPYHTGQANNLFGTFTCAELGDGSLQGSLDQVSDRKRALFSMKTSDRTLQLNGKLDIPVTPIIGVSPAAALDFGTINVGQFSDSQFTITNNGAGTLQGAVTLDALGFFIVNSDGSYSLGPGDSAKISIRFQPGKAGDFSGTATFTGGGGATRDLVGVGQASSTQ